jgi:hypothetical protein
MSVIQRYTEGSQFQDSFGKKYHLNQKKLDMVASICHPSSGRVGQTGRFQSKLAWVKSQNLSPKQPQQKGLKV